MSWSSWAKSIAKEAQRGIDKVLEINEADGQPIQPGGDATVPDPAAVGDVDDDTHLVPSLPPDTTNTIANTDGQPPPVQKQKSIEIGANSHTTVTTNGQSGDHSHDHLHPADWNNSEWSQDWGEDQSKPEPRKLKPKKSTSPKTKNTSPKSRTKGTKKVTTTDQQSSSPPSSPPPSPIENGPSTEVDSTLELDPTVSPTPSPPPPAPSSPTATPEPSIPEQFRIDPNQTAMLHHVSEHADSLGNSFQILTEQLFKREQQIITLSTNTAHVQAENDELRGQTEYYQEQCRHHAAQLENHAASQKKIEPTFSNSIHTLLHISLKLSLA